MVVVEERVMEHSKLKKVSQTLISRRRPGVTILGFGVDCFSLLFFGFFFRGLLRLSSATVMVKVLFVDAGTY